AGRLLRLAKEPPLRLAAKLLVRALPFSLAVKSLWDAADRPPYLWGVLHAARQAQREGHKRVAAIEFGVAEGYGLLALQRHAATVARETSIETQVFGFDTGHGLSEGTGDYRDHPDVWRAGDYPMDTK